ncbi:MAG TPA: DUF1800 domain-containing protein [Fimbriimonadaceae bacterium]|nr:DUF1800 domain-containing protein [Fimbriimonadaceae bacterium]HRJ32461.1 DUF1800 domain-containing protein [Fimbriimonadaceae bacterium]
MAITTDREKIAHILRRFGFGASEAELEFYSQRGLKGTIDTLLNPESVAETHVLDVDRLRSPRDNSLNMLSVQSWWASQFLTTNRPLLHKMTLFWHDHFATSADKVDVSSAMLQHIRMLQSHALGKFRDLLTAASQDPAMVYWLDNQFNIKGKPNENFAREVMELFTLGIGHYSEKDIQEAARAFTGWTFGVGPRRFQPEKPRGQASFVFRPENHDTGVKSILGNRGNFDGIDVLGILCGHPQTATYLTTKIWEWFAYPNPAPGLVERLAAKFRNSGLDIKVLLREVMSSSEFYSETAERAIVKNPIDFCTSTIRQLGVGAALIESVKEPREDREEDANQVRRAMAPARLMATSAASMGMKLLHPPDVAGWQSGGGWISSATMIERIQWADRLFGTSSGRVPSLRYPAFSLTNGSGSPESLVQAMISVFDVNLPSSKIQSLVKAAQEATGGNRLSASNSGPAAIAVGRLIFGTPEFQFA